MGAGSREREADGYGGRGDGMADNNGKEGAGKVTGDTNGEWDGAEELRRRTLAGGVVEPGDGGQEGGEWDVRLRGRQI